MPELPDVEGFRSVLERHAKGRRVRAVEVPDRAMLRDTTPQALGRAVADRAFRTPERHGKWLIAPVGDVELLMHFGMTGLLTWCGRGEPRHRHDRIVFVCEGGELRYGNMRRFGGLWLARGNRERVTGRLGPDAGDLDAGELAELLAGRRGAIKPALMDQRLLAGVGNLMADETLWRARINPRARAGRLSAGRVARLHEALAEVVRDSVPTGRVPSGEGWFTTVREQRGARCPRCGDGLRTDTVGGRTTRWCPRCQRR